MLLSLARPGSDREEKKNENVPGLGHTANMFQKPLFIYIYMMGNLNLKIYISEFFVVETGKKKEDSTDGWLFDFVNENNEFHILLGTEGVIRCTDWLRGV